MANDSDDSITKEDIEASVRLAGECNALVEALRDWMTGDGSKDDVALRLAGVTMASSRFQSTVGADKFARAKSLRLAEFYPEIELLGPGWRKEDLPI